LTSEWRVPVVVIGHGTNLLFDDEGVRGVVVKIGKLMSRCDVEATRVTAEAGAWVPQVARAAAKAGLTGLEHTIGIPGTLGGLVAMNGGSQRQSIGDVVETVHALDQQGRLCRLTGRDCRFSYRSSVFQELPWVVAKVEMRCDPGNGREIRREMLAVLRDRNKKFPRKEPNCGSVFAGDPRMYDRFGPPGRVIEEAGLKGYRIGDAQVSPHHANFIVNVGRATSRDVLDLIRFVRETVHRRTGIRMRCEVRYVNGSGRVGPAHEVPAHAAPAPGKPSLCAPCRPGGPRSLTPRHYGMGPS
jgi:UDP-N-acetylmuramate dehydrogenase